MQGLPGGAVAPPGPMLPPPPASPIRNYGDSALNYPVPCPTAADQRAERNGRCVRGSARDCACRPAGDKAGISVRMVVASVHRSGEKRAIRRMRPGVRGQRSAEVEPAKPLERCAFFCRTMRWETLHLKVMADRAGFEPAIELPLYTLSRRAPSTARPPVRNARRSARNSLYAGRSRLRLLPCGFGPRSLLSLSVGPDAVLSRPDRMALWP